MNKPSYGVIVGRFQVNDLHDGHLELFREVSGRHNRVIVFVGVAPTGMTRSNPLDFETRRRMIQAKFPNFSVHPLVDVSSDKYWSQCLDKEIDKLADWGEVTLYGGRDSFVPHYFGKYKPVELCLHPSTSGTAIREAITNNVLYSPDFRAGVIYAANNLRPRVVTCVDVIIAHQGGRNTELISPTDFLLAKKPGEELWRFVGGHAEPTTPDFEADAKKEAYEETGLDINSLDYVGSTLIDDWRWRSNPDKIKTLIFIGWTNYSKAKADDDICEVGWFNLTKLNIDMFVPAHKPIFEKLMTYLERKHAVATNHQSA